MNLTSGIVIELSDMFVERIILRSYECSKIRFCSYNDNPACNGRILSFFLF